MMTWIWLGAVVLFGAAEAVTAGLVSIWFVAGAMAALLATILDTSILMQIIIFLVVSIAALVLTRPLAKKLNAQKAIPTNLDRVLGQTGRVTETIDNENSTGAVYVDGKTWSARSTDGTVFAVGSSVTVSKMEGVKLFVEQKNMKESIKS